MYTVHGNKCYYTGQQLCNTTWLHMYISICKRNIEHTNSAYVVWRRCNLAKVFSPMAWFDRRS